MTVRKLQSFPPEFTRNPDTLRVQYDYEDKHFIGHMRPEMGKDKLISWVGYLWRKKKDDPKTDKPFLVCRTKEAWTCGDTLRGLAREAATPWGVSG